MREKRRGIVVRSATKISIFSMRPTCVANIADIKRQARVVAGGDLQQKGVAWKKKEAGVFAAERLTCNELP